MKRFFFFAALALAVLFGAGSPADAAFRIRIEAGTTTGPGIVLTDEVNETGAASGFAGTPGAITFSGPLIGTPFTLNSTTGVTSPQYPQSGYYDAIDLMNLTISSNVGGTIRLILENTGFTNAPDGPITLEQSIGGVLTAGVGSSITVDSYADASNAVPDLGADVNPVGVLAPVTGIGPGSAKVSQTFGPGAFSGTTSSGGGFVKSGPYSMYQVITVTFAPVSSGTSSVSFNSITATNPAPTGLVLLASAAPALGLGAWLRRRKAKAQAS